MPKSQEKCRQMREDMRNKILKMSSLYFAKNGFGETKISDLARHMGIGQGTIYLYFKSKEDLFEEIRSAADNKEDVKKIRMLNRLSFKARTKLDKISEDVCRRLAEDEDYCVRIILQTQIMLESEDDLFSNDLYKELGKIIRQGQEEGSLLKGDETELADLYWSNVYLFALKRLSGKNTVSLRKETLNRLLEN